MNRLKNLIKAVDLTIKQLRVEGDFQDKFMKIVQLAQSPFVKGLMANFNVDPKLLDSVFDGLLHDKQVSDIVETIANIFECFSVNRFVGVETEKEMEDMAKSLNDKKLFYAGVFFGNNGYDNNKEFSYKLRMDSDNTPVTLENRNRFWFPGPNANFELDMRYHRGFIQIQHILDQAIIKTVVDEVNAARQEVWYRTTTTENPTESEETESSISSSGSEFDSSISKETTESDATDSSTDMTKSFELETERANDDISVSTTSEISSSSTNQSNESNSVQKSTESIDRLNTNNASTTTKEPTLVRKRRQLNMLSNVFSGWDDDDDDESKFPGHIDFGNLQTYTKQFPYPAYHRDGFRTGLYLVQAIQLAFFFALIVQVSNAVRNRIWLKESGNSTVNDNSYFKKKKLFRNKYVK